MTARPPQWLFDEITKLPSETRGWALGFMCAGWLAGRDAATESTTYRELDVPHCPCGSVRATAMPSSRFEGQRGWDITCSDCDNDLMYTLSLDGVPAWLSLVAVRTSRGRMPDDTSDPPEE
jgi:hypothetical protein